MNEITPKHLFATTIIVGIVIIAFIVPLYGNRSFERANSLSATAYVDYSQTNPTRTTNFLGRRDVYIPNLITNYSVSPYGHTNTQTTFYTNPSTTSSYYYTTTYEDTNYQYTDGGYGYTPPGCESGTDYSLTTGEPCG